MAIPMRTPKIFHHVSKYVSHRRAGLAYRRCFDLLGVALVDTPMEADIVVLHDEPWTYARHFLVWPELKEKYVVSYTVWETDRLPPDVKDGLRFVDEVWTASTFCQKVLSQGHTNVQLIPHVVEPLVLDEKADNRLKRLINYRKDAFYFYIISKARDLRKNLPAAIRVLRDLIRPGQIYCIVKSDMELNYDLGEREPGFILLPYYIKDSEIASLHHIGNCLVSPHCSEGWGLALSEAMICGNMVVATEYGGNTDFMNSNNSILINYRMDYIYRNHTFYPDFRYKNMKWAWIDENDLRCELLQCYEDWDALKPLRCQARSDMNRYNTKCISDMIRERLDTIYDIGMIA